MGQRGVLKMGRWLDTGAKTMEEDPWKGIEAGLFKEMASTLSLLRRSHSPGRPRICHPETG